MNEIPDRADFRSFAVKNKASGYKALGFAWQSYQIRRSTNSSTILLLGLTGAGKSHTINNILGTTVTPLGDKKSCTREINEFTIEMPSKDLGISNSKLHVVDTPGFGDTQGGIQFDATVLANICQLFEKRKYLPNIILLAVNMNDERLDGEFSSFVKLLNAIKIQLTGPVLDKDHSNLIVVLTHLCGAIPKLQRDPNGKKSLIKKIIAENLGISDVPVEVAENCWDAYELQKKKDYILLPNKELFPRNIYLGMVKIVKAIDPVGHGIINEAYPMLQKQKPDILHTRHPVMEIPQTREIVNDIMRMQISSNTELGDRLGQTWPHLSQDEKNDCRLQPTELGLKLSCMGYKKVEDIPRSNKDLMCFYRELSPDKGMEILLRKAAGVEAPRFQQLDLLIGRAFDITRDKITSFNLFMPGSEGLTTIGCYLPNHVRASICPEVQFTCNVLQSSADMVQQRLKQLKINISIGNIGFKYDSRNGFNIMSQSSSNKLTAVYEQRLIKLEWNHISTISAELKSAVENLPTTYNNHDANNVLKWKNFFSTYGTHYVMSSYIGGSIIFEITNENSTSSSSNFNIQSGGVSGFFDLLFGGGSYSKSSSSSSSSSSTQRDLHIIVQGGDSTKASALANSQNQLQFSDRLKEWEETIWDNPMVTDLSITLGEVSDVVNCIQPSVVNAMKNAMVDLYHARLEYEALPPEPTRASDSAANRNSGASCLLPDTLIMTPEGQVQISKLKPGDEVINAQGQVVQVIGVNRVYTLGSDTQIFGFKGSKWGSQPFFTSGHPFLAAPASFSKYSSRELLVASKYELETFHPQMKTELFSVQEMTHVGDIEMLEWDENEGHCKEVKVPGLTDVPVGHVGQELFFLAVEGDGTYIANGFACYHELPNFAAWPRTFVAIYGVLEIFTHAMLQHKEMEAELDFSAFLVLQTLALKILGEWHLCMKNNQGSFDGEKNGDDLKLNSIITTEFSKVLSSGHCASLGMLVYAHCGEILHQYLDDMKNDMKPLLDIAKRVIEEEMAKYD